MKQITPRPAFLALATFAVFGTVRGQDPEFHTRVSAAARMIWGIEANFGQAPTTGVGNLAGPLTGGGLDRIYDDGYVKRDGSGNAGGLTSNWGYQKGSQIEGDSVAMHSVSGLSTAAQNGVGDDPRFGFEVTVSRNFDRSGRVTLGGLVAFNYTGVDIRSTTPVAGVATLLTDHYGLGGSLPPQAPFNGSFGGPNILLNDVPERTTTTVPSTVTGARGIDADLFGIKLGLQFEIELCRAATLSLAVGPTLVYADGDVRFNEQVNYSEHTVDVSGRGSKSDALVGGFVDVRLNWRLGDHVTLFGGGGFQGVHDLKFEVAGREARLKLGSTWNAVAGVAWNF